MIDNNCHFLTKILTILKSIQHIIMIGLGLWCLTPLSTILKSIQHNIIIGLGFVMFNATFYNIEEYTT